MVSFFHRILLSLPPELAHTLAFFFLRIYQKFLTFFNFPRRDFPFISIKNIASVRFLNRVGLAAGFDKNAEAFLALSKMGFGFIEVGTVTPKSQFGNPKPRLWRVEPQGLINQMGFNNCGLDKFVQNIKTIRPHCSVPILANIGKNKITPNELALQDYQILLDHLESWVDGFVVNVSSPNTVGLRDLQSVEFLSRLESLIPNKPVFVKLAPDLSDSAFKELFSLVHQSQRYSGCVLTNTSREIALREYHRAEGGYSGLKMFERTLEVVSLGREIFKEDKTIIAVGGISSVERAQSLRASGADLVEVYTGFVYQGPQFIKRLANSLSD